MSRPFRTSDVTPNMPRGYQIRYDEKKLLWRIWVSTGADWVPTGSAYHTQLHAYRATQDIAGRAK